MMRTPPTRPTDRVPEDRREAGPVRSAHARPEICAIARAIPPVAILAAFCGSACLFLIELFAGKLLLPRFGGAPAVWISCLAFFQLALVAASFHADRLISGCTLRTQLILQTAIFAGAAAIAPAGLAFAAAASPQSVGLPLPLAVILVLAVGVGPAFFAVATLAPVFGHWRTFTGGRDADDDAAYGLYAAGNAGSFAALIGYPLVIEPMVGLADQASLSGRLYGLVAVLMVVCGWAAAAGQAGVHERTAVHPDGQTASAPRVDWSTWVGWIALTALPASWLAGLTTYATVEIAPLPLLWVVPLAVYLASFVVVFSSWGRLLRRHEIPALATAVGLAAWLLAGDVSEPTWMVLPAHLAIFLVVCVAVHGRLVDHRPPARHLATFYLAMAIGGACGGLFNALVAPAIFDAHHEFPLAVACTASLSPAVVVLGRTGRLGVALTTAVSVAGTLLLSPWLSVSRTVWLGMIALGITAFLTALRGWERSAALAGMLLATFAIGEASRNVVHRTRTFFGVLRVCEDANGPSHVLMHGSIKHGVQLVSDASARRRIPLSYYGEAGPLGSIFGGVAAVRPPRRVGIAGLGVGTIASFARPGQEFVFYEIDPEVVRIARNPSWFTFLGDCAGNVRVVVDDARLALEREADGSLDLLVIDAFTGDSVPTHLLTREALSLYGRKLTAEGVVALHVSNKYLDFVPVVERLADDGGWMAIHGRDDDVPSDLARSPSEWMALSRSLETIKAIYSRPTSERWKWQPAVDNPAGRPWTDDRTSVTEALRR